jgi:hypothetical protein
VSATGYRRPLESQTDSWTFASCLGVIKIRLNSAERARRSRGQAAERGPLLSWGAPRRRHRCAKVEVLSTILSPAGDAHAGRRAGRGVCVSEAALFAVTSGFEPKCTIRNFFRCSS